MYYSFKIFIKIFISFSVDEYIDAETKHTPCEDLLSLNTLKDQIQYICRAATTQKYASNRNRTARTNLAYKRRRPSSSAGSGADEYDSSPQATQIQNLPGYCSQKKRRKFFDQRLIISHDVQKKEQAAANDGTVEIDQSKRAPDVCTETNINRQMNNELGTKTREKELMSMNARPSTSFKQTSAMTADLSVPDEILSETILDNLTFQNELADIINNGVASTSCILENNSKNDGNESMQDHLNQAMPIIMERMEKMKAFDEVVREAIDTASRQIWPDTETHSQLSSSTPNKSSEYEDHVGTQSVAHASVPHHIEDVQQPTESIKQRLRPRKKSQHLNNSITESPKIKCTKKKREKDIEVISNEYIGTLSDCALQQPPPQNQQQKLYLVKTDGDGSLYWMDPSTSIMFAAGPTLHSGYDQSQQFQSATIDSAMIPMANSNNNNLNIPIMIDPSMFIPSLMTSSSSLEPGIILNTNDLQNTIMLAGDSNQKCTDPLDNNNSRNRIIVIDDSNDDGFADNIANISAINYPKSVKKTEQTIPQFFLSQSKDKLINFKQQLAEPKSSTPKQLIQSVNPCSSKSLSTPRHKISHVRVLDFTTPSRVKLNDITATFTGGYEQSNLSRLINETPLNKSIASIVPNSAPPKINSMNEGSSHIQNPPLLHPEESSSVDTVIHFGRDNDEDTVISVGSETPKVRKRHRNSCVRTLSSHKEANAQEAEERLKRLAKTKKKITNEDDSSGENNVDANKNSETAVVATTTKNTEEDAINEWNRIRLASQNANLFEQNLREQNSKQQEKQEKATRAKRLKRRTRKKKEIPLKTKDKKKENEINLNDTEVANASINSSMENDAENSSMLALQAQMLEDNLKSVKKCTPEKWCGKPKIKKKTPIRKMHIKLPKSPKIKAALKREKIATKLTTASAPPAEKLTSDTIKQNQEAKPDEPEEVKDELVKDNNECSVKISRTNTSDDLEVAQNLLELNDVIIQQEKQQNSQANVNKSESACEASQKIITTMTSTTIVNDAPPSICQVKINEKTISAPHRINHHEHLSISTLLETPLKLDALTMFPNTPGNPMHAHLVTPLLKSNLNPMDVSIMKNPEFPTPKFPITPGSILTPFKDITTSPRSDHEITYGASNRPTDYSSSSSYYKPDESDGVDKQLQALIKSCRSHGSYNIYSSDEIDVNEECNLPVSNEQHSANENETINVCENKPGDESNRLHYSSSSSSSSSSDDSDSDTSNSSSDSSDTNSSIKLKTNTSVNQPLTIPSVEITTSFDINSESAIKSHIHSSTTTSQSILVESAAPIVDTHAEEVERLQQILKEKRLRTQGRIRESELKKPEKFAQPNVTKKIRSLAEARHEPIRLQQLVRSPLKRKLAQSRKLNINRTQPAARSIILTQAKSQSSLKPTNKKRTAEAERLIAEAANDNAIIDTFVVKKQNKSAEIVQNVDEESIDAIENHLANIINDAPTEPIRSLPTTDNAKDTTTSLSKDNLIEVLEDTKEEILVQKKSPTKTIKEIEALPLRKPSARLTKARQENTKKKSTLETAKPLNVQLKTQTKNEKSIKTVNNKPPAQITSTEHEKKPTIIVEKSELKEKLKTSEQTPSVSVSVLAIEEKPQIDSAFTPMKTRHSAQIREIFGDLTDIETPIKSPAANHSKIQQIDSTENVLVVSPNDEKTKNEISTSKLESTVNSDYSESSSDDESDDDEPLDMVIIDESDKKHFQTVISKTHESKKATNSCSHVFNTVNLVMDEIKIALTVSDYMEIYKEDLCSAINIMQNRVNLPNTTKKSNPSSPRKMYSSPKKLKTEDSSAKHHSDGKPLQTTTTSSASKLEHNHQAVPIFKIKHKET